MCKWPSNEDWSRGFVDVVVVVVIVVVEVEE